MEKYYILTWILSLFFMGTGCLIMDMIYNKEEEEFIVRTFKPKISMVDIYKNEDSFIDSLETNEISYDYLENSEEKYIASDDSVL